MAARVGKTAPVWRPRNMTPVWSHAHATGTVTIDHVDGRPARTVVDRDREPTTVRRPSRVVCARDDVVLCAVGANDVQSAGTGRICDHAAPRRPANLLDLERSGREIARRPSARARDGQDDLRG